MNLLLDKLYYGNTLEAWLIAAVLAIVILVALELFKKFALKHMFALRSRIQKDSYELVIDLFKNTKLFFLLVLSIYIASRILTFPTGIQGLLRSVLVIALLVQLAVWGNRSISFWLASYTRRKLKEDAAAVTMFTAFSYVARTILWALLLLIALDNLGFNVRTLIAGVGIGGIAVALGVQNILKDLFASLSIATDKPFVYGDFIQAGDFQGEVEQVGLKTTRLRSLTGEQIIISNSDLLQSRIRNYQRMAERRIVFTLGVSYQTSAEKVEKIPQMLREMIERDEVRIDRIHFSKLGDSSMDFEIVYFVKSADYNLYMDIQHDINLKILRRFEAEGIAFAYPTRSIYVEKLPSA